MNHKCRASRFGELPRRVTSHDEDDVMPPARRQRAAHGKQIETSGVDRSGCGMQDALGLCETRATAVPEDADAVDHFIRARLKQKDWSRAALHQTLGRRLHLDPSAAAMPEVAAFVMSPYSSHPSHATNGTDATYEQLRSPPPRRASARNGLTLAHPRYATARLSATCRCVVSRLGYLRVQCGPAVRPVHHEQDVGDLLPNATLDQRIANGFHRGATVTLGADQNGRTRAQLQDRVNTVAPLVRHVARVRAVPHAQVRSIPHAVTTACMPTSTAPCLS